MHIANDGTVTLGGLRFSADTRMDDVASAPAEQWKFTRYPAGNAFLTLLSPLRLNGVSFSAKVYFPTHEKPPEITLHPLPEDPAVYGYTAPQAFEVSRRWLRTLLPEDAPARDTAELLQYEFPWGALHTALIRDREYGFSGGTVEIRFRKQAVKAF